MSAGEQQGTNAPRRSELTAENQWRFNCFIELGFPADDAITLANTKADHWDVGRALAKGCSHAQALKIFT